MLFFTIGHSTRELQHFVALLEEHSIAQLVDVRKLPGSNRYPQFNADSLSQDLAQHGVKFTRFEGLTGRRPVSKDIAFDVNAWWRNRSFHNYADHALSAEFQSAIRALYAKGAQKPTAIMCSEAVWWRCHRRIITDYLISAGHPVCHIMDNHQTMSAEMSAGAELQSNGLVLYPPDSDR